MKLKDVGFTLMHPFCNEGGERIPLQFEAWKTYPDWVWDGVKIVLIDDGSNPPLESYYPKDNELNVNLKIYRINEDLRFNLPGAWNLAFHVADTEWVYAVDSDKHHTRENFLKVLELDVTDHGFYQFKHHKHTNIERLLQPRKWDSGSWLLRKEYWAAIDGFDEELTGARSKSRGYWDPDFNYRLNKVVRRTYVPDIFIEDYMPDYFGHSPNPHTGWHNKINRRRYAAKKNGEIEHPTEMLRFTWEQVHEQKRT